MTLAHALDQSGPHIEVLIVAGGFFLLGVIFFIQKSVKPVVSVGLVALAIALGTGAFTLGTYPPAAEGRRVVIREPKPGDVVDARERLRLDIALIGGELASRPNATDGGHLHVLVDGAVVEFAGVTTTPRIEPLGQGEHTLQVEYVDSQHLSFKPKVTDTIEIRAE